MNNHNSNGDNGKNENRSMKIVYTIVEDKQRGKSFWNRVGVAFQNRDGSLNLKLDALPVNGTLQVRDWEPREEQQGQGRSSAFDTPRQGAAAA